MIDVNGTKESIEARRMGVKPATQSRLEDENAGCFGNTTELDQLDQENMGVARRRVKTKVKMASEDESQDEGSRWRVKGKSGGGSSSRKENKRT